MTNTAMLEKAIAVSGFKKFRIAERMRINAYTLALKINNEREFKASEIDMLCKILDLNVEQRMMIFFAD